MAFVHLSYVPWIAAAGELKTKPTQHTAQKLREIGILPNVLLCRADRPIPEDERAKISLFSNVREEAVISVWDVDTIYKIPEMLHAQGMDDLICRELEIEAKPADLSVWKKLVYELENPQNEICIELTLVLFGIVTFLLWCERYKTKPIQKMQNTVVPRFMESGYPDIKIRILKHIYVLNPDFILSF